MNENNLLELVNLNQDQLDQLNKYYEMLVEWNKVMNLTAITEKKDVYLKHFYDSLTISKVIDLSKENTLCDIGTGAGFPGLVLKIAYPNLKVTLVDSLNKRLNFLNEVIKELDLKDIITVHSRIEDYKEKEQFDVVVARAVAPLNILLEYAIPLVKVDKYFIAMKGTIDEKEKSSNALKILNAKIIKEDKFLLPKENSNRTLLLIQKEAKTDKIYPRKNSEIIKKPL